MMIDRKSKHPLYPTWSAMINRCSNPNKQGYENYGGRGITVCDSWKDFGQFCEDMGDKPEGTSLDRIDNNKGYSPDNCKWSTRFEQNRNTRANRYLTANGKTQIMADWASETGLSEQVIKRRIDVYGWSEQDALTTPVNGRRATSYNGSKNGKAKLTENSVAQIKEMIKQGVKGRCIAKLFNVSENLISSIKRGQRWSHVEV
jgi:hypothetical protein